MEAYMDRRLALLGAVALLASGCVSSDKYNALKLERDGLSERLSRVQSEVEAAQAREAALQSQLEAFRAAGPNTGALSSNLMEQNANLRAQIEDLQRRYDQAINRIGDGPALPVALTNELTRFADQNPDLVEFDAQRGIVRFKSDVTFASGDASLTSQAQTAIRRFAQILNSSNATGYEIMVAGHTDNVRVSNPETIRRGHRDNWFLSAHRAISVGQELMKQQVSPRRVGVVGYADQRPVASNDSNAGRQQNRRVEVLILPNQIGGGAVSASPVQEVPAATITPGAPARNPAEFK
jgi:chemotaxis protein MotB